VAILEYEDTRTISWVCGENMLANEAWKTATVRRNRRDKSTGWQSSTFDLLGAREGERLPSGVRHGGSAGVCDGVSNDVTGGLWWCCPLWGVGTNWCRRERLRR
jgi:hypothetical protein